MLTLTPITPATSLRVAADAYLDWLDCQVAIGRRSPRTLYNRRHALGWLGDLGSLALGDLRRSHVFIWAESVQRIPGKRKEFCATRDHLAIRSLQALLGWCADRDAVVPGLASRANPGYRSPPARALSREELECFRAVLRARRQRSDIAALRVIADNGARPYEVRLARGANFDGARGALTWPKGKNGKPRLIVLSESSLSIIRPRALRVGAAGYLFPSHERDGAPYTAQHLNRLCKEIARDADIRDPDGVSLKALRHTYATVAYEEGAALTDVSRALSHTSIKTTTEFYLHNAIDPGARRVNALINSPRSRQTGGSYGA